MPEGKRMTRFGILGSLIFIGFIVYEFKMIHGVSIFSLMKDSTNLTEFSTGVDDYISKNSNIW